MNSSFFFFFLIILMQKKKKVIDHPAVYRLQWSATVVYKTRENQLHLQKDASFAKNL